MGVKPFIEEIMEITLLNWLLALSPLLLVILLMLGFKWGGIKAGALVYLYTILLGVVFFGANLEIISYSIIQSILLSLDVLYIIWTALFLYNLVSDAGAIIIIGKKITAFSDDRVIQTLLISWLLVSFLQGVGGFGVPIAITAPILVGIGYSPVSAVVMAAIGHSWAVNFGNFASAFQSLIAVTGVSGNILAPYAAILLGFAAFPCGAIVAYLGGGWNGLKRGLPALIILSVLMGFIQYLLATSGVWTISATVATLTGLTCMYGISRLPIYRSKNSLKTGAPSSSEFESKSPITLVFAILPYTLLILLSLVLIVIPQAKLLFSRVEIVLQFPEMTTSLGWTIPASVGRKINIFGHPGAVIFYATLISYIIYRKKQFLTAQAHKSIINSVIKSATNASLGIVAMVGLATIMNNSGMTNLIAQGFSKSISREFYPAIAPVIGMLGAFITGSNNNSNVLFGLLQMDTAELLGLSMPLILAAQTAGGSIGSVMSPAKVIVGCSTVDLTNNESPVLKKILIFNTITLLAVIILVSLMANIY